VYVKLDEDRILFKVNLNAVMLPGGSMVCTRILTCAPGMSGLVGLDTKEKSVWVVFDVIGTGGIHAAVSDRDPLKRDA